MGIFSNVFKRKVSPKNAVSSTMTTDGWKPLNLLNTYDFYKNNDMENGYASIKVIVNNFAKLEPYTIDNKGEKVSGNLLSRIYAPNDRLSAYDFREALAVMSLIHNKVIIVPRFSGNIKNEKNIKGFTILENFTELYAEETLYYISQDGKQKYNYKDVITILNMNPYNLNYGYAPAASGRRWTTLDDYIASYEKGLFENSAIPAGQFIITAKNKKEFDEMVTILKERHGGVGNNNGVTYTYRPIDVYGNVSSTASIEWQPFSTTNNYLALGEIFNQVNKKIDSIYGVPASLRGVNDSNTYASVKVDERVLISNVVEPMCIKIWGKFTHELNRITGGLGVAISCKAIMPNIAEEDKVNADKKKIESDIILQMMAKGFTYKSVSDAFGLSVDSKKLKLEKIKEEPAPIIKQEPKPEEPKPQEKKKVVCPNCGRYLFMQNGDIDIEEIICPNSKCKARLNFKERV